MTEGGDPSSANILNPQDIVLHEQQMVINSVQNVGGSIKMVEIVPNNTSFSNSNAPVYNFDQNTLTFPIDTGRYAIVQSESYLELKVKVICDLTAANTLAIASGGTANSIFLANNIWWGEKRTRQYNEGVQTFPLITGPKNIMALIYQSEIDLGALRYVEKDVYRHRGYESMFQSVGATNHQETWFVQQNPPNTIRKCNCLNFDTTTNVLNAGVSVCTYQDATEGTAATKWQSDSNCFYDTKKHACQTKTLTFRIPFQYISRCLDPVNSNMLMINSIYGQQLKINITLNQSLGKILGTETVFPASVTDSSNTKISAGIYGAVLKIATKESFNFNQAVAQLPTIMYQLLSEQRNIKPISVNSETQYNIINASHQSINDIVFSIDPNDKSAADSAHYHQISGFLPADDIIKAIRGGNYDIHSAPMFYEFQLEIGGTPVFEKPGIKNLQRFQEITKNSLKLLTKNQQSNIISQPFVLQSLTSNYLVFNVEFFRNAIDANDILADGIDGTQTMAISTKCQYYLTDDTIGTLKTVGYETIAPNLECTVYYDDLMEFQPQQRNAIQREPQVQRTY